MEIINATPAHIERYAAEIPELMHATGPVTYDYQFDTRALFDVVVEQSWRTAGTLFAYDGTTLALDGDELLGIEVGFPGPEFEQRKKALAPLWPPLIANGHATEEQLTTIAERTFYAGFLNVAIPSRAYYVHALAVRPEHQGRGIGKALIEHAETVGKNAGLRGLHLDVLSDNPAVEFYRGLGLECLTETLAPRPHAYGVPMEMRMAKNF